MAKTKPRQLAPIQANELPNEWTVTLLSAFANTATGGTPSRDNPTYFGGGIPWVKSGELGDGYVRDTEETITQEGLDNSNAKKFPKGTLLMALYGATTGKVGILNHRARFSCNGKTLVF
jgi:type I restriction enzyme S subunit